MNTKVNLSGVSIMDNTGDFYSLDSSSILLRRTRQCERDLEVREVLYAF